MLVTFEGVKIDVESETNELLEVHVIVTIDGELKSFPYDVYVKHFVDSAEELLHITKEVLIAIDKVAEHIVMEEFFETFLK